MLKTKFRGNQSTGSGEGDFEGFLPYMGAADISGHVTSIMSSNFHFLVPESFHAKFGLERHSSF